MRLLLAAVLMLLPAVSMAWPSDWAKRQALDELMLAADMSQTLQIATDCRRDEPKYLEANPHLGSCPSHAKVRMWFIGIGIGHYLLANAMPEPMARSFQWGMIIYTGVAGVGHNLKFGLRIKIK